MSGELKAATDALRRLAKSLANHGSEQPYSSLIGWSAPPLSRADLSAEVSNLAIDFDTFEENRLGPSTLGHLKKVPDQVQVLITSTLPNATGTNINILVAAITAFASNLRSYLPLESLPDWDEVADSSLIPKKLSRRIRSLEGSISGLEPRVADVAAQMGAINDAHAAALELPTELEALREAKNEIQRLRKEVDAQASEITSASRTIQTLLETIKTSEDEATKSLANIGTTLSAATSYGLATSFKQRAAALNFTTWVWVAMLFTALLSGGVIGFYRLAAFQQALAVPAAQHWILLNAGMSIISVAAPVWFAWLSTRQISQRFRLSEDYAFKASVAQAYEGYRREASRLDTKLEERLFSSALDRLEEAPLRFIALEEYSSPYEALLASPGFQKIIDKIPTGSREELLRGLASVGKKGKGKRVRMPVLDDVSSATSPSGDKETNEEG